MKRLFFNLLWTGLLFSQDLYLNSGGPTSGIYQSDSFYQGGQTQAVSEWGTGIWRDVRYGQNFKYSVELPNRSYFITFQLFEPNVKISGGRLFTIRANQFTTLPIDIYQRCGFRTMCTYGIFVDITGGRLDLEFKSTVGNAVVSGIEISPSYLAFKSCPIVDGVCTLRKTPSFNLEPRPNISQLFLLSIENNGAPIQNISIKMGDDQVTPLLSQSGSNLMPVRPGGIYTVFFDQGKYYVTSSTVGQ